MTRRDREREALARKAATGDVAATRRLLALNEGAANEGGDRPVREVRGARNWEFWRRLDGAHKVFRDPETGRWAIADDSGDLPERTEDGIIWIDAGQPIAVSPWSYGGQHIGVGAWLERGGGATRFSTSTSGMLWLAARLGLEVDTPDGRFRVTKVGPSQREEPRRYGSISEPNDICDCGRVIRDPDAELCRICQDALGDAY